MADGKENNGKKEGKWTTFYANGNIRSEGTYKSGVKQGKWVQYHKNGKKKNEGVLVNGHYVGRYVSYYPNVKKRAPGGDYYEYTGKSTDGKKVGEWLFYDCDGKKKWIAYPKS